MSTEYEQLLMRLLEEKRSLLTNLDPGRQKQAEEINADIHYLELELDHYSKGLTLFRSKGVPKVGRWGKPEVEDHQRSP